MFTHKESTKRLISKLPKDQCANVLNPEINLYVDISIDETFLGFTEVYEYLSFIIPKHFTVIDLGCGYNAQCFFFTEHQRYIAVDKINCVKFKADNCTIFHEDINDFISKFAHTFDLDKTFAICNYAYKMFPDNGELARKTFTNLFVYYPSIETDEIIIKRGEK